MKRPRPRLVPVLLLLACLGMLGAGVSFASFTRSDSNGFSIGTDRVFPGTRSTPGWIISDAADGSAADVSAATATTDGTYYTTSKFSTAFASNRYVEISFPTTVLPGGVPVSNATLNVEYSGTTAGETACYYVEVRRASTSAVLATYGSSGSPSSCVTGTTLTASTVSLPILASSDDVNDLTVRIYGKNSSSNGFRIDTYTVTGSAYFAFTLGIWKMVDSADTSAATSYHSSGLSGDGSALSAGNWSTSFSASRYVHFTYPTSVMPSSATLAGASFRLSYRSSVNGSNMCWYADVIANGSTVQTLGSSSSPVSCTTSNTTYTTDTVTLTAVDTNAEANSVQIKIYGKSSGSDAIQIDLAELRVSWSLGTGTGCASPGTQTIDTTADTYVRQDGASASSNFGTATSMNVKSDTGKARRVLVYFPLPPVPYGCSITSSVLKMYASTVAGTRTLEAYQVSSSWTETGVTWNNQPSTTGTAATTSNSSGWESWTVTSIVQAIYSGANYGFLVRDSSENATAQQTYSTTELGSNWPTLDITFG